MYMQHTTRPRINRWVSVFALILFSFVMPALSSAQTGGEGGIQGTVVDATGAAIPEATITATNQATNVATTRVASKDGVFTITPLIPGTYTVTVTAKGFGTFTQKNLPIEALKLAGINPTLAAGGASEEVTVSDAPPQLDTTNATLGGAIEAKEYQNLPLLLTGNQQRDITQFSNLLPGAQLNPGGRSSIIGGTEQRLGELYVNGVPLTTISQQGDNRPVFNVIPMEAITEIQVVTSGFSAEYQGIGLENYTIGSGGNKYHGTVADFVRNTIFDAWGFTAPYATITNSQGVKGFQKDVGSKPVDHQNELSASFSGPISIPHIFNGRDKLFFSGTYDRLHSRSAPAYAFATVPTAPMRTGDFSQLLAVNGGPGLAVYDPTTQNACTAANKGVPCRYPFPGNVIPSSELSPIAVAMQKYLPATTNNNLTNNYLGGIPSGYDNYLWAGRIDWNISPRQRLSFSASDGRRHAVPYTATTNVLPVPYLASTLSTVAGSFEDLEYSFTINPHLVNQFNAAYFYFGGPPVRNITEGSPVYSATALGITNLPDGQASSEFPGVSFSGTNAPTNWAQPAITNKTTSHTYDIVDNVNYIAGKHSMNFGIQLQDLMENFSSFNGYSSPITYAFNPNDTANLNGSSFSTASGGFSYASFMLGAVNSASTTLQPFSDIGERFHVVAPYFQDDFKVTPKLTLNIGLRWDYYPPYHEVANRWSFLNPDVTNPFTGNKGALQFAGQYGGPSVSCNCTTPVKTWWKNFGPRVGFAYAPNPTTTIRGAFAVLYTHGGGTGGAAAIGTGQTGFTTPNAVSEPATASATSAPAFYLNNSAYFQAQGLSNTRFGGPNYAFTAPSTPSSSTELATGQVGNFVNASNAFVKSNAGIAYADPYYGDRTPTTYFYNFGIQQAFTNNITFTLNYAGTTSHFLAGPNGIRGLQANQIDPKYFVLGTLLTSAATQANIAAAQNILPGCCGAPYPGFTAAAQTSAGASQATIGQGLKWMPQYSGVTDTWGLYSGNAAYNSLQASLAFREFHGLMLNINYTWSKEIDNVGTIRTGYAIPASVNATGKAWKADRMDRSLSTIESPQNLEMYSVYRLPFGKDHIGGNHFLVRAIAGGWTLSNILTATSGYPLALSSSSCTGVYQPSQGTCMPDVNPNFHGKILKEKWANGVTALNLGTKSYVAGNYLSNTVLGNGVDSNGNSVPCAASSGPFCNPGQFMIGDAPRTGAFGLRSPGNFRLNTGIRRQFDITERWKFIFGVDCQNVTNSVTFGVNAGNIQIPTAVNSANYGQLTYASTDARAFQFSGRISF